MLTLDPFIQIGLLALEPQQCALVVSVIMLMPIALFILAGFEHVVASVTHFVYARTFNWYPLGYFVLMFLGNGVGAVVFSALIKDVSYLSRSKDDKPSSDNL